MPPKSRGRDGGSRSNTAAQTLAEADTLKQRGERRKGLEAVQVLQQAADLYQAALQQGLGAEDVQEARFGLAWCMQLCGDAMREACAALPDDAGSWSAERQARHAAAGMYRRAAAAYREVLAPSGQVREDAATNCGNTLCSLAEALQECAAPTPADPAPGDISVCGSGTLASPAPPSAAAAAAAAEAAACYREAKLCYEAALQQEPEDAAGWSNLADCLMAAAQLLAEGTVPSWQGQDPRAEAEEACRQGLEAYERSCALCDSSQGDDLPGLLCNWGSGLLSAAQMQQDPIARRSLLEQAAARLQHSASFALADPEPLIRLGDTLAAAAELAQQHQGSGFEFMAGVSGDAGQSIQVGSGPGAGAGPARSAAELLERALCEGYGAALALNRNNSEALVGCAEAHASLAKLVAGAGDAAAAESHWSSSIAAYEAALQHPAQLGAFSERCSVRFNHACTLALAGREEQAQAALTALLGCGGVSAADLASDADLARVRGTEWFQQLLAAARQQPGP